VGLGLELVDAQLLEGLGLGGGGELALTDFLDVADNPLARVVRIGKGP